MILEFVGKLLHPFGLSVVLGKFVGLEFFLPETTYKVRCYCFLGNLKFRTNATNLISVCFYNSRLY